MDAPSGTNHVSAYQVLLVRTPTMVKKIEFAFLFSGQLRNSPGFALTRLHITPPSTAVSQKKYRAGPVNWFE